MIAMIAPLLRRFLLGAVWVACAAPGIAIAPGIALADDTCDPTNRGMQTMAAAKIHLVTTGRDPLPLEVLVADDPTERASGYQYICPNIIARTAILFRFPAPMATRFHMHNVKAPLDIGFFDRDGVLIQAMTMWPYSDGNEILYGPMHEFQYALETRRGYFGEHGLAAGHTRLILP